MGKLIKKQDGFTLIELLVTLVLLLIVLALAYMFFNFGIRSFNRGEQRAIAQQAIRTTADFISSEIRYASELTINPANVSSTDDFYYIYMDGDSVYFQDKDKNIPARILLNGTDDQMNYSISFWEDSFEELSSQVNLVIKFLLSSEDIYSLETKIYVLNIKESAHYNDLSSQTGNITGIKYIKPFE